VVWLPRDGKVSRSEVYTDRDQAFEVAGLSK
jgi:ketosteroid isomerase-like protein